MSLTPQDVQAQQFNVRFRGFDVDEVDAFLERIAEELLLVLTENQQLKDRLSASLKDIDSYKNQEKTFHNAIISTQKIADEILDRVKREAHELKETSVSEAEKLLRTARYEADEIKHRSNSEISTLIAEIDRLEQMKNEIQNGLRNLLTDYLTQLDQPKQDFSALRDRPGADLVPLPEDFNVPPPASANPAPVATADEAAAGRETSAEPEQFGELYQKIVLGNDPAESALAQGTTDTEPGVDIAIAEANPVAPAGSLPNLDDDMALSLNDPLDELETSVRISTDVRKFKR